MADDKNQKTIADYVGDMVALEGHIDKALERQLADAKESPVAGPALERFHTMVEANLQALKDHQEQTGKTAGSPLKEAGATILGVAAGLIDKVRTEGVSKDLRDDYTAFNMACISYTMLHATALALGDQATATLAANGLRGHASAVQEINHIIADVVIWELEKDDHQITDSQAAQENRKMVDRVWSQTDKSNMTAASA